MKRGRKPENDYNRHYYDAKSIYLRSDLSLSEIARKVGISRMTIHRWVKKGEWKKWKNEYWQEERQNIKHRTRRRIVYNSKTPIPW